jgi:hypothetical protein
MLEHENEKDTETEAVGPETDTRRHPRISYSEPIRIQFEGDCALVAGCLVNLSVGGAFVRCITPVEVGREFKCAFFLPIQGKKKLVCCRGEVTWIAPPEIRRTIGPGFGLCFTQSQPESAAMLRAFIDRESYLSVASEA